VETEPRPAAVKTSSDAERERWNRRYATGDRVHALAMPSEFLVAEVADLAPGAALDLACGTGRNAVWLAQRGWRVTAVDFSAG
jgi:2-polyprenyl-3-methyl-5-hydroxy-6-metoxy-1,4-benzoquinol methylase